MFDGHVIGTLWVNISVPAPKLRLKLKGSTFSEMCVGKRVVAVAEVKRHSVTGSACTRQVDSIDIAAADVWE